MRALHGLKLVLPLRLDRGPLTDDQAAFTEAFIEATAATDRA